MGEVENRRRLIEERTRARLDGEADRERTDGRTRTEGAHCIVGSVVGFKLRPWEHDNGTEGTGYRVFRQALRVYLMESPGRCNKS